VNQDGTVDLLDAVISLQIAIDGATEGPAVSTEADVDGDERIGIGEAIRILQVASDAGDSHTTGSPLNRNDADALFEAPSIPIFELELPENEWVELQENALLEEYIEAELTYGGENMGPVGLRFRGAAGSLRGCIDENGNLTCVKLGLKIKFSEYERDKRFFGMKRLNFNSMARDSTKMAEKISYGLFRDMGVPASRAAWAVLKVNGASLGLFAMVEQVDGRFTDDRWPEGGDGNLYKEVWPKSPFEGAYDRGIKTNEETATHERMVAFHTAMDSAAPPDRLTVLDEWTDVGQLYNYMAVHDAIMNWDGVTAWYCSGGGCGPHNYYWYQHETDNEFTLIPWDLDSTLRPQSPHVMMNYVPHWTLPPADCSRRFPAFFDIQLAAPGCFPIFQALASDLGRYAEAVQSLIDGPFGVARLTDQIDGYTDFIRQAVAEDPALSGVGPWEASVERLKADLGLLTLKLEHHRDGIPVAPVALLADGVNDFEDLSIISVLLGVSKRSNSNTTISLDMNGQSAIGGKQDIRADFSFRDQATDAWAHWGRVTIPMAGGKQDLSDRTGVRLRLQSGEARPVRIDLEREAFGGGIRYGWEVEVSDMPTLVTLLFAASAIPSWATAPADDREEAIASVWGLSFSPSVKGRGSNGLLGAGVVDEVFLQIDDVEFFEGITWVTVIERGDEWRYLIPSVEPPAHWNTVGFNDGQWSTGPSGFGYGDGDDATVIPPAISVFIRKVFTIADVDGVSVAFLHIDYDDAFVAYLNGVEVARDNIGQPGDDTPYNQPADNAGHEASIYGGGVAEQFEIASIGSILREGNNVLAIQVHNASPGSSDMTAIPSLVLGIVD